ncbi:fluoride efflux transporter CrcB [Vandammella animalimorsus]|uniref:Fluoride-specific ion channel FluC n=1 Tax=Vandammella animalimorsus TaxID=2029117 RepID=A0A2A2A8V7_9BURK|nr:fluoride efflux transporter CrcB [Vandammella animalimorsus]PAT34201.1 fluoride efflux transporter CrcB [Vandammella animalimorsus]
MNLLLVGLGGLLGAIARYVLSLHLSAATAPSAGLAPLPWGTLAVNLLGCLAIGLLAGLAMRGDWLDPALRLFLFTGVLGGFTTFSAFGLEALTLLLQRQWALALGYVLASVGLGLLAVAAGLWAGGGAAALRP